MLWSPFLLTVLFGVIYCNHLLDKGFQRLSPPYAADVKNSDAQRVALLEGITNEDSIFDNIKDNNGLITPLKTPRPCQQANALDRYYGFINCVLGTETENNNLLGKMSFADDIQISNDNSRDNPATFDPKTLYDSSDLSGRPKNENPKINSFFSSDMDIEIPLDMELLRSSLPAISRYNIDDSYDDLLVSEKKMDSKRSGPVSTIGCDCKIKNDLLDLGQRHFPRYLLNAVCQSDDIQPRCWRGICKPLEYKVKVLTFRTIKDHAQKDPALAWLPDDLRQLWKFKTVTVAAGCFCAIG